MELICIGLSHRTAPLAVRERLALPEAAADRAAAAAGAGSHRGAAHLHLQPGGAVPAARRPAASAQRAPRGAAAAWAAPEALDHLYEHQGRGGAGAPVPRGLQPGLHGAGRGADPRPGEGRLRAGARALGAVRGELTRAMRGGVRLRQAGAHGDGHWPGGHVHGVAAVALATQGLRRARGQDGAAGGRGRDGASWPRSHLKQARAGGSSSTNRTLARARGAGGARWAARRGPSRSCSRC